MDQAGRLVITSGDEKIMEGVASVLDTEKGTCPLDPLYGIKIDVYDPMQDAELIGWEIANAIEYAEPRAGKIEVTIKAFDAANNTIYVEVAITPIDSNTKLNRVFPVYRRA
ncbi:MAG: GPW/gp25 family protein [Phycisphaerales bacterium JB052]